MTLPVLLSITLACNPTTGLTSVEDPENPPPPPKNLTASPSSEGLVEGAFSYSSTEHDGFRVYRNAGNGERVHLELEPEETSFVDSKDVAPGEAYVYKVRAFNEAGESPPSNVVEVAVEEGESSSPDSTSSPKPTPDQDALLTGMTPSDMTVPDGWSVHATEDFEGGISAMSRFSTAEHATDRAHTGTGSIANTIIGDGQQNGGSVGGDTNSSEVYISWYEYVEEQARWNDEFVMARAITSDPFHEIMLDYMHGKSFNETIGNYTTIVQGKRSEAFWGTGGQLKDERPRGRWVQYEWRVKANTPGASDGEIDLWRDGTKLLELRNANLNGNHDMTGMRPVVGGTYTKHNWMKQDADGNCIEGQYIGDGGSYRGHPCLEPNTDIPVRCKTFSDGCAVGPAPPVFRHWIDDIIILAR